MGGGHKTDQHTTHSYDKVFCSATVSVRGFEPPLVLTTLIKISLTELIKQKYVKNISIYYLKRMDIFLGNS